MDRSEPDGSEDESLAQKLATIRQQALSLLARREHGRLELKRKLSTKGASGPLIDQVLDELAAEGYLSERRYVESMTRTRAGRGYGPQRVRAELAARGVSGEVIDQVLQEQPQDWLEQARRVLARRFGTERPRDPVERARQYRYLAQRGFSSDQIRQVLESVED